jgi:DNA repair protein RAD57
MGLLLSVQLPVPQGLGKSAAYISTEDPLNTQRLEQMLRYHPYYDNVPLEEQPSFDRVHAMMIKNIEELQRLVEIRLPAFVENLKVGLVILDSVAANFRADRETTTSSGLMNRAVDLNKLGNTLRKLAVEQRVAVVVANQVSDRFQESLILPTQDIFRSSSPASSSATPSQSNLRRAERDAKMTLDHQSRFFSGWGDQPVSTNEDPKNPALGYAWTNQLDARISLKVESRSFADKNADGKRRRFMNVVFAPWTDAKINALEYSIERQGLVARPENPISNEHNDLLDESLWNDDGDEEFPF